MAGAIREAGVKPELEVFDSGDMQLAHQLLESGVLPRPPLFQVVLGIRNGFPATPETLLYAKSLLPGDAVWAAMGIGRMEFPIVAQASLLGGHVRVGRERTSVDRHAVSSEQRLRLSFSQRAGGVFEQERGGGLGVNAGRAGLWFWKR